MTWTAQIKKVKQKVNHGLYTLRRLRGQLDRKCLKILAEGLVMSHLRYCNSTFLSDQIRITENDPKHKNLYELQLLQNKMLRIIHGVKTKDKVPIRKLLEKTEMLSINQLTCQSMLMDTWKATHLGLESISAHFKPRDSVRFKDQLQANSDPQSFVSKSSKLFNMTTQRFKNTNLTKVAKQEAKTFVRSLPII